MDEKKLTATNFFDQLQKNTMHLLDEFYAEVIHFKTPIVQIFSLEDLKKYYQKLYSNYVSIRVQIEEEIVEGNKHVLVKKIIFRPMGINSDKLKSLDCLTVLKFNEEGKVVYQRDYFDVGQFLYESLPLIGTFVKLAKKSAANIE